MSNKPNFNPENPRYKEVADLPEEYRGDFADVDGGFVRKAVVETQKGFVRDAEYRKSSFKDVAHEAALRENEDRKEKEILGNGREAATLINREGLSGVKKIQSQFASLKDLYDPKKFEESYDDRAKRFGSGNAVNLLMADVLRWRNSEHSYKELIDALANEIVKVDKGRGSFQTWTHDLCHRFENYGRSHDVSLFDQPDNIVAERMLINESMERAVEYGNIACVDRILYPLVAYNVDHFQPDDLDGEFILKPDSAALEKFSEIWNQGKGTDQKKIVAHFLESSTPREFIIAMVKDGLRLSDKPERVVNLLSAVEQDVSRDDINAYVDKFCRVNNQKTIFEDLERGLADAMDATERAKGLYVDVEGTLLRDGKLNDHVMFYVEKAAEEGNPVVIFTGGSPNAQTEELRKLKFPEQFLPVVSKSSYRGKILESLIDDTPPEYQGFKAEKYRDH